MEFCNSTIPLPPFVYHLSYNEITVNKFPSIIFFVNVRHWWKAAPSNAKMVLLYRACQRKYKGCMLNEFKYSAVLEYQTWSTILRVKFLRELTHKIFRLLLHDRVDYNCALCADSTEETLIHLFWNCPFSLSCWTNLVPTKQRGISAFDEIVLTTISKAI